MAYHEIVSYDELTEQLKPGGSSFCLFYKEGSNSSECALENFSQGSEKFPDKKYYAVNVSKTRDIHEKYQLTSVPVIIEFEDSKPVNYIKGCHDMQYLEVLFSGQKFTTVPSLSGGGGNQVIVYSTPTCTYCNSLKNYLSNHKIPFRDIDVSKNQKAAEEMVKRSGQQGVPQTLINNEVIIGFDKSRIDQLLHLS